MALTDISVQLRKPAVAIKVALALTAAGILLFAPIYLGAQWAPAQSPTAPWYVALVREPLFAKIMLFGKGPAFWPLFGVVWALALTFWGITFAGRPKAQRENGNERVSPARISPSPLQDNDPQSRAA